jgi:hypothetical protein
MKLIQDLLSMSVSTSVVEEEEGTWPLLLAQADEFRVECDEDKNVHLLDGEQSIRASMPLKVWKQLVTSASFPPKLMK